MYFSLLLLCVHLFWESECDGKSDTIYVTVGICHLLSLLVKDKSSNSTECLAHN